MDDSLVIHLLGEVTVRSNGKALLDHLGHKEVALLIYLVCTQRPQPRETLADLFWGARPKAQGQANLRTLLTRLRRVLSPHLVVHRDIITFDGNQPYWLDVAEFQAQASAAYAPPLLPDGRLSRSAADTLARALRLYRGDFLAGFHVRDANGFEDWAAGERERLRRIALAGLTQLADFCLERGQYAAGLDHTTRLLAFDSLDEAAHRRMMHLLALSGQRHTALAQYEACRRALADELNVEPDSETTALYERIRDNKLKIENEELKNTDTQRFSIFNSQFSISRYNFPAQTMPLIGREAELARLRGRLLSPDCRLITIAGAGGIGKTRLALVAAKQVWIEFADGVYHIALAEIASGQQLNPQQARAALADAITDALGFTAHGPDTAAELCDGLRQTELLLLLDGLECLIGGANLLAELLRSAPNISILATSRQPLNLQSEQIMRLRGLPVPASEHDPNTATFSSVRLFVERVERLGVELSIAEQLPEIVQICRMAAGLPLAIELAALLAGRMPLTEIAWAMEHNPDLLATSAGDLPERHRSLRALFESAWRLLSQNERRVLAECSAFRGSFISEATLAALSAEIIDLSDVLAALANKSLLRRSPSGQYEVDQLLRPFAAEQIS